MKGHRRPWVVFETRESALMRSTDSFTSSSILVMWAGVLSTIIHFSGRTRTRTSQNQPGDFL